MTIYSHKVFAYFVTNVAGIPLVHRYEAVYAALRFVATATINPPSTPSAIASWILCKMIAPREDMLAV
jgi:hypothetical protein